MSSASEAQYLPHHSCTTLAGTHDHCASLAYTGFDVGTVLTAAGVLILIGVLIAVGIQRFSST